MDINLKKSRIYKLKKSAVKFFRRDDRIDFVSMKQANSPSKKEEQLFAQFFWTLLNSSRTQLSFFFLQKEKLYLQLFIKGIR